MSLSRTPQRSTLQNLAMAILSNTTLKELVEQLKPHVLHMVDCQYQHLDGMYFRIRLKNSDKSAYIYIY